MAKIFPVIPADIGAMAYRSSFRMRPASRWGRERDGRVGLLFSSSPSCPQHCQATLSLVGDDRLSPLSLILKAGRRGAWRRAWAYGSQ